MAELRQLLINGRLYYSDARLKEFRAVDNPHDRLSWDTVDSHPDAYDFGPMAAAPTIVTYTRTDNGMLLGLHGPAEDGRPFFKDLPPLVKAAAMLRYAATWPQNRIKLKAAQTVEKYQAVKEDILYKCALDVGLDPDNPRHRPFITDAGVYQDDYSLRGVNPMRFADRADQLFTDDADIALGRAIFVREKAFPEVSSVHVVEPRPGPRFTSYPVLVRLKARIGLFLSETPWERNVLGDAVRLPVAQQHAIWDDILCARADAILRRQRRHDRALNLPDHSRDFEPELPTRKGPTR